MAALTLDTLRAQGSAGYPRHALRDSSSALVVFCAAFGGKQDAVWIEEAGLVATCVDQDELRLREMRDAYPETWTFVEADAFEYLERAAAEGLSWDVVSLDPFTNQMDRVAEMLPEICSVADELVIVGTGRFTDVSAPDGWQIVDTRKRSDFNGGTFWVVLQRCGEGIDPADVTACLVTKGDVDLDPILETLPYPEVVVWDNSRAEDWKTAGRYAAAIFRQSRRVVYFQDDDTRFRFHDELCAAYRPGGITAVYGHGETPGGYDDLPLVCGGGLADVEPLAAALDRYREHVGRDLDEWELAYADFIVGILVPFRHVFLPFEIDLAVAQHPSRLCNQTGAYEAKARVTAIARELRDS